jgi:hypothetical protein
MTILINIVHLRCSKATVECKLSNFKTVAGSTACSIADAAEAHQQGVVTQNCGGTTAKNIKARAGQERQQDKQAMFVTWKMSGCLQRMIDFN